MKLTLISIILSNNTPIPPFGADKGKIMTASELKYQVESRDTESHFFTRSTMRFFGDTMRNYGVRGPIRIKDSTDEDVMVYELYRRKPVKHGLKSSTYFAVDNFERVYAKRD